jgi:hypothetical protein
MINFNRQLCIFKLIRFHELFAHRFNENGPGIIVFRMICVCAIYDNCNFNPECNY